MCGMDTARIVIWLVGRYRLFTQSTSLSHHPFIAPRYTEMGEIKECERSIKCIPKREL